MGRRRFDILIPFILFTTRDLKAHNPSVSPFVIQRNLEGWIAQGKVGRIGTETLRGPGKACYMFQVLKKLEHASHR